jgi:hypothetical protein
MNVLDITRSKEVLAFDPATSLEAGIRNTWTWLVGGAAATGY